MTLQDHQQQKKWAKPDRIEPPVINLLTANPFTTLKYAGSTYINVYQEDHAYDTGNIVAFRGEPLVFSAGSSTEETSFAPVQSFDGVTDISNSNGFTITVGKINSLGIVSDTLNYYYFKSSGTATKGNVSGGGEQCSSGPVTLQA